MALDVYREIPSVLISTALGLRPRAVLISTSGIFPVYRLKPCVNLYIQHRPKTRGLAHWLRNESSFHLLCSQHWLKRPKRAGKSGGQCSVVRWYMMKKRQWRTLLLLSSWPYPTPLEWAASPQRMFWKWSVRQPAVREELLIPSPGSCPLLWGSLCCLQMKSWLNLMTTVLLVQNILHKLMEALDTSPQWVVKLVWPSWEVIHSQPDWTGGDIPAAGTVKCWLGVGAPGDEGEGGWTGGKVWSVPLIHHRAQGDDPISEDIAGALPEGHLGGVLQLMSSWETRYLTFSQTLPHSVCGFQLGPHTSSLSGSSVTMFTGFPASLVTMLCLLSFKQPVLWWTHYCV